MLGAGPGRRQQHKYQIDRLVVDRVERDRPLQPRANNPQRRDSSVSLPCGMAMPRPIPVDPAARRSARTS